MVNQVDKDATGDIRFPNFLDLMSQKFSDNNAEDEIREAFKVFDNVSTRCRKICEKQKKLPGFGTRPLTPQSNQITGSSRKIGTVFLAFELLCKEDLL